MQRTIFNFILAIEGVLANQLRTFLTALGIIFGVAAVIAMLAIGTGAKQSILDQLKLVGTNNIVINGKPLEKRQEEEATAQATSNSNESDEEKPWSPGLTVNDIQAIEKVVPGLDRVSPEVLISTNLITAGKLQKVNCVGATNAFFELNNLQLGEGKLFSDFHLEHGQPVCIIGQDIKTRFFSEEAALGSKIKCGNTWLTIIGVLKRRSASDESLASLGIRDYNSDVYIPISTALLRFEDRSLVSKADIQRNDRDRRPTDDNHHQIDRVVLRVEDASRLQATAKMVARLLKRRHYDIIDYEIEVPELLLQQQQKTQETFNFVLAVIAGISLLVGGIGIMNIMLASVLERIKEIGLRRSLGATKVDIILQFLFESIFISLIGGLIGVILGIVAANTIASYADIPTVVSWWSVLLSFGVAASIGLIFGIFPAQKAAIQDPIKALRSD